MKHIIKVDDNTAGSIEREKGSAGGFISKDAYGRIVTETPNYGEALWSLLETPEGDIWITEEE